MDPNVYNDTIAPAIKTLNEQADNADTGEKALRVRSALVRLLRQSPDLELTVPLFLCVRTAAEKLTSFDFHIEAISLYLMAREHVDPEDGTERSKDVFEALLNDVIDIYSKQGDYAGALPLRKEKRAFVSKTYGDKSQQYITALHQLAFCYYKLKRYEEALRWKREEHRLHCKRRGEWHEQSRSMLREITVLDLLMHRGLEAVESAEEYLRAFEGHSTGSELKKALQYVSETALEAAELDLQRDACLEKGLAAAERRVQMAEEDIAEYKQSQLARGRSELLSAARESSYEDYFAAVDSAIRCLEALGRGADAAAYLRQWLVVLEESGLLSAESKWRAAKAEHQLHYSELLIASGDRGTAREIISSVIPVLMEKGRQEDELLLKARWLEELLR